MNSFEVLTWEDRPYPLVEFPLPNAPCTVESNLTKLLSPDHWKQVRRVAYQKTGGICQICDRTGAEWPVTGRPIWEFDRSTEHETGYGIQRLVDVIPICPDCLELYMVISGLYRYGYTSRLEEALQYYSELTDTSPQDSERKIRLNGLKVAKLGKIPWALDVRTWLDNNGLSHVQIIDRFVVQYLNGTIMGGM